MQSAQKPPHCIPDDKTLDNSHDSGAHLPWSWRMGDLAFRAARSWRTRPESFGVPALSPPKGPVSNHTPHLPTHPGNPSLLRSHCSSLCPSSTDVCPAKLDTFGRKLDTSGPETDTLARKRGHIDPSGWTHPGVRSLPPPARSRRDPGVPGRRLHVGAPLVGALLSSPTPSTHASPAHPPSSPTPPSSPLTPSSLDTSSAKVDTFGREVDTSGQKLDTLPPKVDTFGRKGDTSASPSGHIPVTPASPSTSPRRRGPSSNHRFKLAQATPGNPPGPTTPNLRLSSLATHFS